MKDIEKDWRRVAAGQHATITTRQLRAAGLSSRQIAARVGVGILVPVHRGVHRVGGAPMSWHQAVMAACLATGGVATRRSAAALWAMRGCDPGVVEVSVLRRRQAELVGVDCHMTGKLDPLDVTVVDGVPVTAPARTLLDLGGAVRPFAVERAMEGALHAGLVTTRELEEALRRVGARGRNGTAVLRQLLRARGSAQAPTESPLEDDMVRLLQRANLPQPVRQYPMKLPDGRTIRLDLAYPDRRIAIELQGFVWHATRADLQRDCDRANLLRVLGWHLLVFTSHDVRRRPGHTIGLVWKAISGVEHTWEVHSAPENPNLVG